MPDHATTSLTLCIDAWAVAMGRACWQGGSALLLAWALCRLLRLAPQVQCWIWRLAYLKLLIAFCWSHPINLPLLPAPAPPAPLVLPSTALLPSTAFMPLRAGVATEHRATADLPAPPASPDRIWQSLFVIWLAGGLWYAGRTARNGSDIRRLRARCRALDDPAMIAACAELCAQHGLRRCPDLLLHVGMGYPQLAGVWRPAIVLPEAFWGQCTSAERRLILAHELAHIRRCDLLWAWVPLLSRCLFFFLPPVWLAEREWQQSQEIACDEQVLRLASASRGEYGNMLLKIALLPRPELTPGLMAMRIAESYSVVQRRLLTMKHAGTTPRRTLLAAGALLTAAGVIGLIPWRVSAQDNPKQAKDAAEQRANKEGARQKLAGTEAGLSKDVARQLQLSDDQAKRAQELAMTGAQQVLALLTPEQQQIIAPRDMSLDRMLRLLNLTATQQTQAKALMERRDAQAQSIKSDETLTPEERDARIVHLRQGIVEAWTQILTPAQQAQMNTLMTPPQTEEDWLQLTEAQRAATETLKRNLKLQARAIMQDETLSDDERKPRLEAAAKDMKEKSLQLLTPDQREMVAAREAQAQANRETGPFHLVTLERVDNLTPEQRTHIQAIYHEVERLFARTLTAPQKQKLQSLMEKTAQGN